jgi:spore coat protein U-like protein
MRASRSIRRLAPRAARGVMLLALALGAAPADAETTAGQSMAVRVTLVDGCSLQNVGTLDFGTVLPGVTMADSRPASATFKVTRAGALTPYTIYFGGSKIPSGSGAGRRNMTLGKVKGSPKSDANIPYKLCQDSACAMPWDDVGTPYGKVTSGRDPHTVYGVIPAGTTVTTTGDYSDTITITVTF